MRRAGKGGEKGQRRRMVTKGRSIRSQWQLRPDRPDGYKSVLRKMRRVDQTAM
jgi:hypothetical protein